MMRIGRFFVLVLIFAVLGAASVARPAAGWDAEGHRIVTLLALERLPPAAAASLLRDPGFREGVAFLSNEADRWRATVTPPIGHENKPDHYIDLELLSEYALGPATLPSFRYDYLAAMAVARHDNPGRVSPYDRSRDRDRSLEWPGFLPHAIVEHHAKLEASLRTLRILESLGPRARPAELEAARASVAVEMGHVSHFAADAAQPLHTTKHFNGWAGDNPEGYTTDKGFHALIDGGLIARHGVTAELVRPRVVSGRSIDARAPWPAVMEHVLRAFERVEPLYRLEKSGDLQKDAGRDFVVERLADAAGFLAALYGAAWEASAPTEEQIAKFLEYDGRREPGSAPGPAPGPRPGEEKPGG